jgi:glycosyltransferase involved in cell wall biosynthesis
VRVSVVIPAYNEERIIGACLAALRDQEVPPDEIIVVDNNSSDRTGTVAAEHGARVVVERERGVVAARNRGFDEATGDVIGRIDADTIVSRGWVAALHSCFGELATDPSVGAASGPIRFYDCPRPPLCETVFYRVYEPLARRLIGHAILVGPNMALRRDIWLDIRDEVCSDETSMHEDLDLAIHIGWRSTVATVPGMAASVSARTVSSPRKVAVYPYRFARIMARHGGSARRHTARQ